MRGIDVFMFICFQKDEVLAELKEYARDEENPSDRVTQLN